MAPSAAVAVAGFSRQRRARLDWRASRGSHHRAQAAAAVMLASLLCLQLLPAPRESAEQSAFVQGCQRSALPGRAIRPPPRSQRRFFGGESEVERLRRENAELKSELEKSRGPVGNFFAKLADGAKSLLGLGGGKPQAGSPREMQRSSRTDWFDGWDSAQSQRGSSLATRATTGLLGSFFGKVMDLAFGDVSSDVDRVRSAAADAIRRSGAVSADASIGSVLGQSYSSININGRQSTNVGLQFQMVDGRRTSMVSCQAVLSDGQLDLQDVRLDGRGIDTRMDAGGVIDV